MSIFADGMITELSILIPTYNYCCVELVRDLHSQAVLLNVPFEIIVADDGSENKKTVQDNSSINLLQHCRFIRREENIGRSAIRNFLVQQSKYSTLLFLDGDGKIDNPDFLKNYMTNNAPVVDGGVDILYDKTLENNLKYKYEYANKEKHNAFKRQSRPYQHFRTTNFMVSRNIMIRFPFDERYRYYGYEDVILGKTFHQNNIHICHINNPICMEGMENNPDFVKKTEEGLRTLYSFKDELKDYSRLLTFLQRQNSLIISCIQTFHHCFGNLERKNLVGNHPQLWIFKLYKIGYYLDYAKELSSVASL